MAELGAVLLLFHVGLESTPKEMMAVGGRAALVAVVGVVTPMLLGFGVGELMRPDEPWMLHAFLGAMLAATSVGITARVLKDVPTQRVADGLLLGMSDARFDVRYRSAQALGRLRAQAPGVSVPAGKVFEIAAREARRAGDSPRHLDHVFSVLAVVLFDRVGHVLRPGCEDNLLRDPRRLAAILDHYAIGLDPD